MLIGPAGSVTQGKEEDLLADAGCLYKVDAKALRNAVAKSEKEKARKKAEATSTKEKPAPKIKATRK
jgi:hypothetical protein